MTFPLKTAQWMPVLTIVLVSFCLWIWNAQINSILVFKSDAIMDGELWRLITGHFLHTNFNHLLLNCAGLTLLWALHGEYYRPMPYAILFLTFCFGTGLGLLFVSQSSSYVGLSGALHGLFVWGAIKDIENGYKTGWLLLIGVWLKVMYEQVAGSSEFVAKLIASNVATDAHLYGAISGSLMLILLFLNKKRAPEDAQ